MRDNSYITITQEEYRDLIINQAKYLNIMNYIFRDEHIELNYSKDDLSINTDIRDLLKYFEPNSYDAKLRKLLKEQENKEAK